MPTYQKTIGEFSPLIIQPPPPPPDNGAQDLVTQGWNTAQDYARTAFDEATGFLARLEDISEGIADIPTVNVEIDPLTTTLTPYVAPDAPVEPDGFTVNLPPVPTEPTLTAVTPLDVQEPPEFTAVAPDVNFDIALPTPLTATVPAKPDQDAITIPATPTYTLPAVPSLLGIEIPTAPTLEFPEFTAVLADRPTEPGVTFAFTEEAYTSTLLTNLRDVLNTWVNGAATGLSTAVEQAIWDRGRERETQVGLRKQDEVRRTFASRGFALPPGAMNTFLLEAIQEAQDKASSFNRDVAIKQAELEQQNRQFAFQQAFQVESALITYQNQIAQRAFEAARFVQQVAVEIFGQLVARYNADVNAYQTQAQVYKIRIEAQIARLEVYKTEIEAQKLVAEINREQVAIYGEQIRAVVALIEVYKAQLQGAQTQAEINKNRIQAFAAEVSAYEALVRAKAQEYDAYSRRIEAEVSKVKVYESQSSAFRSQIEGFKALVEAQVAEKESELKVNQEIPLELFAKRTEAFRNVVQAESERLRAVSAQWEGRVRAFVAEVSAEADRVKAGADVYKAEGDVKVAEANVRIEAARANIQKLAESVRLLLGSTEAGARVAAQLAASALSAINLSGGISASTSENRSASSSNSSSYNSSNSYSYSHTYSESAD